MKKKLALFASGTGTNVRNIIVYFSGNESIEVDCVLSNKETAGALGHALDHDIDCYAFCNDDFENGEVLSLLLERGVDYIILAGFLLKISSQVIKAYEGRILNIHPALLPKYGGKGMYGMHVHEAVVNAGEEISGITIHQVNEHYDEGAIVEQFEIAVKGCDANQVAAKIHELEQAHFPNVIENFILNRKA